MFVKLGKPFSEIVRRWDDQGCVKRRNRGLDLCLHLICWLFMISRDKFVLPQRCRASVLSTRFARWEVRGCCALWADFTQLFSRFAFSSEFCYQWKCCFKCGFINHHFSQTFCATPVLEKHQTFIYFAVFQYFKSWNFCSKAKKMWISLSNL